MFKKLINNYDIISFDVFDTLVTRCFLKPDDVFRYIEYREDAEGFVCARKQAESNAFNRDNGLKCYEVTLEEIYEQIPGKYKFLKDIELEIEKKCIIVNPVGCELYLDAISKGKQIIIVSDSYLPKTFIENILHDLGYISFNNLFVSSEVNKTKRNGNLYSDVIQKFKKEKILHIGDNYHSDFIIPQEIGINAIHLNERSYDNCFSNHNSRVFQFFESNTDQSLLAKTSILAKMDLLRFRNEDENNFWNNVGFCYAGPMIFSFLKWIENNAHEKEITHILFVARDGYFLNEFFSKINSNISTTYLYLNRAIIDSLSNDDCNKEKYIKYLKSIVSSNKIMVVDVGTNNFSMQKFLIEHGIDCVGSYWCTGRDVDELEYSKFFKSTSIPNIDSFFGSGLIEFFMTSPEPPIVDVAINNHLLPIYASQILPYEKYRISVLQEMMVGIQNYSKYYLKYIKQLDFLFSSDDIINWNLFWLNYPSNEEKEEFGKIYHASDDEHVKYSPQFNFTSSVNKVDEIKTIKRYLVLLKNRLTRWI
ncbi:HAD-IA family hydrolase [Vibrio mangrovi]|uniref:HAD-IA family hydrolase n=1 Tax=Vibrio mangrovi TaxID=474394 RepID=A0A1Y6IXI7_9VIBR|nr:HAD-IA family hydrolase [Vibrio mangrovi]MDW6002195.1 HAD-IA family hydrolase [Vibrio mangrovi]SMS01540.1 hypothetical protein VIM7927_02836 [Vibrio mangrovi]